MKNVRERKIFSDKNMHERKIFGDKNMRERKIWHYSLINMPIVAALQFVRRIADLFRVI
jgi:deoxyadenosine/deoxycytidine kinase